MLPPYQLLIDIWEGNTDLDVQKLKLSGVTGAIVRLNDMNGGHHLDKLFTFNWGLAKQFTTQTLYYVYNPWVNGKANHDWLIANLPSDFGKRRLMVDIEVKYDGYSPTTYANEVANFVALTTQHFPIAIYTGGWFVSLVATWPKNVDYWWAAYPNVLLTCKTWEAYNSALSTLSFSGFTKNSPGPCRLWQSSGDGVVRPGFGNHAVDVSVFPGTLSDLQNWLGCEITEGDIPMGWKDNALGIVVDQSMNVDFAELKKQGCSFVVIEAGKILTPNASLADQCSKANAAGIPVMLQYTPAPALVNVTYDQHPQVQLAEVRKWIANKKFYGFITSIEDNKTFDTGVIVGDGTISNTSKVISETLDSELKAKGIKTLVRTNDGFVQGYSPSISSWTDKFGFFLADWRYRTRDVSGNWTVYTSFPSGTTNTIADIQNIFPTADMKNPAVPGNSPQLKFWEYTNKYTLSCVKGWDGSAKPVKVVRFNGVEADCYAYLGFTGTVVTPPTPPPPSTDLEARVTALETKYSDLVTKLHTI